GVRDERRQAFSRRSLIPAVVPDLYLPRLDAHGKGRSGLVGRRSERGAGLDAKARAVTGTNDLGALDGTACQLPAVVRADVFDGVVVAPEIEYHDLRAVRIHLAPLPGRQLALLRYGDPIGHLNRDVMGYERWVLSILPITETVTVRRRRLRCRARSAAPSPRSPRACRRSSCDSCRTRPGSGP